MCDNPETSILLLKPWNSTCNRQNTETKLSGGAPISNMCLCLQSGERCVPFIYTAEYTLK